MTEPEYTVTRSFLLLALGIVWYAWPYQRLRAVALEQDLRTIRDDLFDYMWKHNLSYDHLTYRQLRLCFNGFIRLATTGRMGVSLPLTTILHKESITVRGMQYNSLLANVRNPGLRLKLEEAELRLKQRLFRFFYLEGLARFVLYPIIWSIWLFTGSSPVKSWCNAPYLQRVCCYAWRIGRLSIPKAHLVLGLDRARL